MNMKSVNSFPAIIEVQFEGEHIVNGYLVVSQQDLYEFCGDLAKEMHQKRAGFRYRVVATAQSSCKANE